MGLELPQRVLFVSHDGFLGGAQLALADTITALLDADIDVHVLIPRDKGPLAARLRDTGAAVHFGPVGLWGQPPYGPTRGRVRTSAGILTAGVAAAALVHRTSTELVVSNTGLVTAGAVAARLTKKPHWWWLHERQERDDALPFVFRLDRVRRAMNASGHLVVPSSFLAAECARWTPSERIHMIRPFVALDATAQDVDKLVSVRPQRVLFPGGLQAVKRPMDVLKAFAKVVEAHPDMVLEIIGYDGPERAAVEAFITDRGLTDKVRIRGFQPSMTHDLEPGAVLVSAGTFETFGRVLVEAMSAGVPVIAADAGASTEVIDHQATGLLYEPANIDDLARCLLLLVEDSRLRRSLIMAGGQKSRSHWTQDQHLADLSKAWRALTRERSS